MATFWHPTAKYNWRELTGDAGSRSVALNPLGMFALRLKFPRYPERRFDVHRVGSNGFH